MDIFLSEQIRERRRRKGLGKAADRFELLGNTGHYLKKASKSCSPQS